MRRLATGVLLAAICAGQGQDLDLLRTEVRRIQSLVEQGILPPARLEEARERLEEAEDEAVLRRTLYLGTAADLTEEDAAAMVAAARRRLERQQRRLEQARRAVEAGAASRLSLTPVLEEADLRRRALDLAESRLRLVRELAEMARAEQALLARLEQNERGVVQLIERFDGHGLFRPQDLELVRRAFEREFSKPLPISASGQTAVHRALGFDHSGRVDVAVNPDTPEGFWLRRFLESAGIPYYAIRGPVPGSATGAHIHIGPPSGRLRGD
ncbi:MAG: hypothetical protein RMK57_15905 [Bryobacterales bacterium]|nr:hypothetical protein [Bryobacteraceae bacterium]MDW8356006.1 hypothetical protein [Bryobacterales bacterium]